MSKSYTFSPIRNNLECGFDPNNIASGREPCQLGWYNVVSKIISSTVDFSLKSPTILDVGCGMYKGVELMSAELPQATVYGQDIDHRLTAINNKIITSCIYDIESKAYDFVICFDVIEHVIDDLKFFNNLKRISRDTLFITTPNFTRSKAQNYCHCREYTIPQFINFFQPDELWVGSPDGWLHVHKIIEKKDNMFIDLTRSNTIYDSISENLDFTHSTVDGNEWPHFMGVFKI